MADATYQPLTYRKSGGDVTVIASGGELLVESGGVVTVESGGSIAVESGGSISIASGGSVVTAVQTAATTATTITASGLTLVTGTTAGPTFLIANPLVGVVKYLSLNATSSGATHRALISPASTAVSFDTTGGNEITLATSAVRGITLVGMTTATYRIVGVYTGASIAAPRTT